MISNALPSLLQDCQQIGWVCEYIIIHVDDANMCTEPDALTCGTARRKKVTIVVVVVGIHPRDDNDDEVSDEHVDSFGMRLRM